MNTIQEYIELLAARNEQIRELQERISGLEIEMVKREAEIYILRTPIFAAYSIGTLLLRCMGNLTVNCVMWRTGRHRAVM